MIAFLLSSLVLISPSLAADAPAPAKDASPLEVKSFKVEATLQSLLYLPEGYASSQEKWPLMIFLHGAGQKGRDTEKLKKNGPPMLISKGRKFPFIVFAPQCPSDGYWREPEQIKQLDTLLAELLKTYRIDESRLYLTGLSMGAHGTWTWAETHPDRFAAIAPICGGGNSGKAALLTKLPIWAFHGDADDVVSYKQSESTVAALRKAGAGDNLKFTTYPGVKHDAWTATYNNDELFTWFLAQRKTLVAKP
jgi:predicted peptidase